MTVTLYVMLDVNTLFHRTRSRDSWRLVTSTEPADAERLVSADTCCCLGFVRSLDLEPNLERVLSACWTLAAGAPCQLLVLRPPKLFLFFQFFCIFSMKMRVSLFSQCSLKKTHRNRGQAVLELK